VSRPPVHCADRSGFLFAHACDQPPARTCSRCRKPICLRHTRSTADGPVCIACLRRQDSDTSSTTSDGTSSPSGAGAGAVTAAAVAAGTFGGAGAAGAWEDPSAGGPRDDPYFYGTSADRAAYYDADDFRAFDVAAAGASDTASDTAGGDPLETDTGAS
jgi:hypothetical protein